MSRMTTAAVLAAAMTVTVVAHGRASSALPERSGLSQQGVEPGTVTFNKDIAPILSEHCWTCHRPGGSAAFSLLTYEQVKGRATQIATVTARRFMPPWKPEPGYGEFVGERRLNAAQIQLIEAWVGQGAVEGDPTDAPPKPTWPEGWQLGQPDLVVQMPQPYVLPASGADVVADVFRNFVIPIPVTSRRYVKGIEFLPDNPTVVHHATMRIDQTRTSRRFDDVDAEPGYGGFLQAFSARYPDGHYLAWFPGQLRPLAPDGLSWRVDPGTDLVLQLHLRPTGKPQVIRPSIGFFFTDTPPTRVPSMIRLSRQDIDIAAGEREYVIEDQYVLPVDVELHVIQPHAHYLARQIQGLARLPDGTTRWLIYIKDWDFHWQDVYRLAVPLQLPKGTTLLMRYIYDNSADNERNPRHPPQRVRFGQNSADEMGDLWLQVFPRARQDLMLLNQHFRQKMLREDIVGYQHMLAAHPDNAILHEGLASCYLELGQGDRALRHLQTSLRLDPDSANGQHNLGTALVAQGKPNEAIAHFENALRLMPDFASVHNSLGDALQTQGKLDEAIAHYRQALLFEPNYGFAHNNLGNALRSLGRLEEAIGHYERAAAINPEDPVPHRNWGKALAAQGNMREALVHHRAALDMLPDSPAVLMELAWILAAHPEAEMRAPEEALRLAERAAELTAHQNPEVLDLLAAAYANVSQFDRAIVTARSAMALAIKGQADRLAAEIRSRLHFYEQHKPYRHDFLGVSVKPR